MLMLLCRPPMELGSGQKAVFETEHSKRLPLASARTGSGPKGKTVDFDTLLPMIPKSV
jgi:hypothetical protein